MKTKKILITGVVLLLVMFFIGTCDALLSDEDEIEYTDVVYSMRAAGGPEVTIYLDGATVPITKSAKRAMSRPLAEMAFDFLEVIFVAGNDVARNSWELGEPAGISGITRGTTDYINAFPVNPGTTAAAALFAGKSADKTLLGVGKIYAIGGSAVTGTAIIGTANSVTFRLAAVTTGLTISTETISYPVPPVTRPNPDPNPRDAVFSSFRFNNGSGDYANNSTTNSSLLTLGNNNYPLYTMATVSANTPIIAQYQFTLGGVVTGPLTGTGLTDYSNAIRNWGGDVYIPKVQKREPRYMDGGAFKQPKDHTDTKTDVVIATAYLTAAAAVTPANVNTVCNLTVPLSITVKPTSAGLFSFFLQMPVFCVDNRAAAKNSGPDATRWYIRTGYGSDLYNIDDGGSSGGCVLMGVGASSSDWINIDWDWIQ